MCDKSRTEIIMFAMAVDMIRPSPISKIFSFILKNCYHYGNSNEENDNSQANAEIFHYAVANVNYATNH